MAKVTVDNLSAAVKEVVEKYGEEVNQNVDKATKEAARKGVQALKSQSARFGSGYAGGWKAEYESKRYGTLATIWNARVPGLPHLLEYGHATRNGGRVAGQEHIAPVEEQLVETFTQEMEAALK